jgi:uncharacterized protein
MTKSKDVFLTAEWLDLALLNYVVEPSLLQAFVPQGTALGSFEGKTYLSLVGFRFSKTKLWGRFSVPFHQEFEEINLRFYVHRAVGSEIRRGVVFIKEIVPKPAIALTARLAYGENYVSLPTKHRVAATWDNREVEYCWKHRGNWSRLVARSAVASKLPAENSIERYITEHYWGYSRQKSGRTLEYHVTHIPWSVQFASEARFEGDATALYGQDLANVLSRPPDSAYIAEGSPIEVLAGEEI